MINFKFKKVINLNQNGTIMNFFQLFFLVALSAVPYSYAMQTKKVLPAQLILYGGIFEKKDQELIELAQENKNDNPESPKQFVKQEGVFKMDEES